MLRQLFNILTGHSHVKKHGYEIYRKNLLLIDFRFYKEQESAIEGSCFHPFKEIGDFLVGIYDNGNIRYLHRYCSKAGLENLKKLSKNSYQI